MIIAADPDFRPASSSERLIWSHVAAPTHKTPASAEPNADLHQAQTEALERASPRDSEATVPGGSILRTSSPKASISSRGTVEQTLRISPPPDWTASATRPRRYEVKEDNYFFTPMNRPRPILPACVFCCISTISAPKDLKSSMSPPRMRRASKVSCSVSMAM